MLTREFYSIIATEETAVRFLQQHGLLQSEDETDPCLRCGSVMVQKRKRDRNGEFRPVFRCPRKGCQTTRSVRSGNRFFHYTDLNNKLHCNLSLCAILEIVYYFLMDTTIEVASAHTGRSTHTLVDWYTMCREVCSSVISVRSRGRLHGTINDPVQIDESRFAGRRKYNRGRLLNGDQAAESDDSDADVENNRNHGRRIDGPWVFGLATKAEVRYFVVQRRDQATLLAIIQREVEMGSVIHSDEWPAYRQLQALGYQHSTVNHQQNYIDPDSGANTQLVERRWLDAKVHIMKKMRSVPLNQLQGHLDYMAYKILRKTSEDKFITFLQDLRNVYVD
ncbi:hypothetical protein PPYR_11313 [Photinus pyralis]|uniref:ISXO2-like transposase domain-containing protein n=2 Tax=Photinus pyralis TaxID=7054 RepID=A0A5N4AAY2_PHOPY|nr:hypothetical protein PPYR_11313 [Photinus pyralis]